MFDKKTFVIAVAVSWALTLVTVLLINSFTPSLPQPFPQQSTESNSAKVVTLIKEEVRNIPEIQNSIGTLFPNVLDLNFTWIPSYPNKNSILALICSFEYSCEELPSIVWENEDGINWVLGFRVNIDRYDFNPSNVAQKSAKNQTEWNLQWTSEWKTATFQTTLNSENEKQLNQNQKQYPIKLTFKHNGVVPTYIRNVNLMLLVIDG